MTGDDQQSDHTESKVREWATRVNGEPLTNRDIVELVLAVDDDGNTRHKETLDLFDDNQARIMLLEEWRQSCPDRHADHVTTYHAPRRADDPDESDFCDRRGHVHDGEPRRFTKEQVVTAVILFLVSIAANATIVWFIVHALEEAAK